MVSKWVLYRNKFIGSLVNKYTEDLDYVLDIGSNDEILLKYINPLLLYIGVDKERRGKYSIKANIMKWSPPGKIPGYTPERFSVVVMQEVLEHLPLPVNENMIPLLFRVKDWLKPEGHLIVSVPNFLRLTNRISEPKYLDETHNMEFFSNDIDLFTCGHYDIVEKHFIVLYLPYENQIGFLVSDILRRLILRIFPTWASHIVYVLKPKEIS